MRLSPNHGLNASIDLCFFCGEEKGLVLPGMLKGDVEAPREAAWSKEPCDQCKGWMEKGVMLVEVNEELTTDRQNPWRTGRLVVVADAFVSRVFQPQGMVDRILKSRVAFITIETYERLGLDKAQVE